MAAAVPSLSISRSAKSSMINTFVTEGNESRHDQKGSCRARRNSKQTNNIFRDEPDGDIQRDEFKDAEADKIVRPQRRHSKYDMALAFA